MYRDRIRHPSLFGKVVSAEEAASLIKDGMTVGMSGFTRSGEAKAVPFALAERAKTDPLKITLLTGASLGNDLDKTLVEAGVLARRLPFQADPALRKAINRGEVMFIDQHLSETVEMLRTRQLGPIDVAVVEAVAITEDGGIIPTTSVGNSATFAILAEKVIIEINLSQPVELEGLHDIYIPTRRPFREPIPIVACESRVGLPFIPIDPSKIAAIVVTEKKDSAATVAPPDADTRAIAGHLIEFLRHEVSLGRLSNTLQPLQAGIGSIANAVLHGLIESPFHSLKMYSEVLQDSTFDLFDAGKLLFASGSSITLSEEKYRAVLPNLPSYKNRILLRPQEISNHPEIIRRLGLIGINTALEFDLYGNVNSTHVGGTMMMNGIGGSGDFARNCYLSVFVTKSIAKNGAISSVVPMVSHVDHTEHDVDILITEIGLADLRGLAPRERAKVVIDNCVHPAYRDQLADYYRRALTRGGHTPHLIEEAFSWHVRAAKTGSMREAVAAD
ncbi:acetyl-CoA hydrolase/transferase family protein [Rhodospirillum rubrum]|uniref:Acetyl-CoA hydrolase n=1 Tax=Rhodospirillum rubrum (strain ATCC 11170 / ATH 1.1.1 / DSM 467 / LMG 4362 / NCIMB 8255 / S1) TaxID=269796 RepID=Q2RT18_RHORT|nr:acetyl-CoA hydrolase/transferase family protein [Rhodospirillum rubrum]ABC22727.1 Acetyl-CoA hydrolase [Rhodospirillum rubrum ATCC 11170]AEO48447.1 acetyl-CoA hydrolase [Rhodospirillum rubrum F11]MBK5954325.1 propionyl-CoA--succinate CoA transferase [Rhodospirillum rubrum]QXG78719.1 acetyl-CoA hydrolase/transferase family protein [Rhodospirillum rubrum]